MKHFVYTNNFVVKVDENTYYYIDIDNLFNLYEKFENCLEKIKNERFCNKLMLSDIVEMYKRGIIREVNQEEIRKLEKQQEVIFASN